MPQLVNLFLVIFGVIATGVGLAGLRSHPGIAAFPLALGIAVVVLAYFSDLRRKRRADERKRVAVQQRVDALTRQSSLQVGGGTRHIVVGALVASLGAGALYVDSVSASHDVMLLFFGALFTLLGLLVLARALAGVGEPLLDLTASGFITPLNGRIAWRDVSGIFLQVITPRYGSQSFSLMFRVKQFARVAPRIHWTDRLMAMFRLGALTKGVVTIGLPSSKEPPAAIYALARQLWKQSTGHDYAWIPSMSNEYNDAMQRAGEFSASLNEDGAIEAAMANPERISISMAQMERDTAFIAAESKRQKAKAKWTLAAFPLLTLLVIAWPWIRRLFQS